MNKSKYVVTYEIDYKHRVVIGVTSESEETAVQVAKQAFDEGIIWDDTEKMPLLYDDYEEVDGETLVFYAEKITEYPKVDSSVIAMKEKEFAFQACRALLAGEIESAMKLAGNACPQEYSSFADAVFLAVFNCGAKNMTFKIRCFNVTR
ncbi:MAG: hypothetical protein Q7U57_07050 [Methylovulum sp.]|nr:hypothetical protein [Methylovulum sp.]